MRTFSIKFSDDQATLIELLAAEHGQTLSEYIRERVLAKDDLRETLAHMQSGLHAAIGEGFRQREQAGPSTTPNDAQTTLLLETVLRLRALSNPTTTAAIFAEMKRLGVTPYTA